MMHADSEHVDMENGGSHQPGCNHDHEEQDDIPSEEITSAESNNSNSNDDSETLTSELFTAVSYGFKSHIQRILGKNRSIVNAVDASGFTPAHWAAKKADAGILQALHEHGADLGLPTATETGMLPIHWAASEGRLSVMRYILSHRQDLNVTDRNGCSPVIIATQYNQADAIVFLLQSGADLSLRDNNGDTALHWAAYKGHAELIGLLAHRMPQELNSPDIFGQSPLHLAALRGNDDCVEFLLDNCRADTTMRDKNGLTPLELTVKKSQLKTEWLLRSHLTGRSVFTIARDIGYKRLKNVMFLRFLLLGFNDREISAWPWRIVFGSNFLGSVVTLVMAFDEHMSDLSLLHQINTVVQVIWWVMFTMCLLKSPSVVHDNTNEANGRYSYESGLQIIYRDGDNLAPDQHPVLCHTCRVRRPLRSKHCKIQRKCINKFDHFCPFVGNTVGRDNYKFFIGLLVTHVVAGTLWQLTAFWLWRRTRISWTLMFFMFYSAMWMLMIFSLLGYHIQLMMSNLSTNEHINVGKYTYLRNSYGIFDNPFEKGSKWNNVLDSLFPSEKLVYHRDEVFYSEKV